MSLCTLCQTIDFLNIPKLSALWNAYSIPKESSIVSILKRSSPRANPDQASDQDDVTLGLPFHQSLDALKESSADCPICQVVERDVAQFRSEWAEHVEARPRKKTEGPDWKMWLTTSGSDLSGFFVVSFDVEVKREIHVLSAVGLCVNNEDPLNMLVAGRPIEADSSSEVTIKRALDWIRRCDEEHAETKCLVSDAELPGRVLDVCESARGDVRLVTVQGQHGKYAALSHVWGDRTPYTTTSDNLEEYKNGIAIEDIPKTFQDAVKLSRHLGLQYLWIDALCICQDDLPSWGRDSEIVASIFSNAYITLSATGASDDTEGLFTTRSRPSYTSFTYTHSNTTGTISASSLPKEYAVFPAKSNSIRDDPLSQQGWALQERYLSPRILHFSTTQLFYECNAHFLSESGLKLSGRVESPHVSVQRPSWFTAAAASEDLSPKPPVWQAVLGAYCRRTLPRSGDKLPALANLARAVHTDAPDEYLAGLWRANFIEGMMWQAIGFSAGKLSEAPEYRAPSWSWASIDGPFGIYCMGVGSDAGMWADLLEIQDCKITLKDKDKPYGEVHAAELKLQAPVETLYLAKDATPGPPSPQVWRLKTKHGNEQGTACIFDTPTRAEKAKVGDLKAVLLAKNKKEGSEGWVYHGVVVKGVEWREDVYERVGKIVFDEESWGKEMGVETMVLV